jgi:PIN domain nuclease of toxin-antitoxin system
MTTVLDASAILAFVQGEQGADTVEEALVAGAMCGTANWSEVAQKVLGADRDWELVRALLNSYDIRLEPVSAEDAESAARRWRRGHGLSLGDRLCMALADRTDSTILTSDAAWGSDGRINQIR